MKKLGILTALLLISAVYGGVNLISSTPSSLVFEVDNNFVLEKSREEGLEFTKVLLKGAGKTYERGKPELPIMGRFAVVPDVADIEVDVEVLEAETLRNILVYPSQQLPVDKEGVEPPPFEFDEGFYSRNVLYPETWGSYTTPNKLRGVPITSILVACARYNPGERKLILLKRARVSVKFKGGTLNIDERLINPIFENFLKSLVINSNLIPSAPKVRTKDLEGADIIFITPDDFVDTLMPLVRFRHYSGLASKVVTLSEIGTSPSADDIRNYIKDAYNNWPLPPTFVVIVGDVELVPTHYKFQHPFTGEYIGTDVYYGEMDETWNPPFPDLFVGRISVDNVSQLSVYINKVLTYDRNPPVDNNWLNTFLLAAYEESGRYFVATSETIYVHLSPLGYNINRQYEGGNPPGSTQGVIDAINGGIFIANHRDHGASRNSGSSYDGWVHPNFTTNHLSQLSNGMHLPVFFANNCESGWFDGETDDNPSYSYESLGEELIRMQGGGAIGYIGSSRVSYSGYNDELDKGYFDAIWPDFDPNYPTSSSTNPYLEPIRYLGGVLNFGKFWMYDKYVLTGGAGYPWSPDPDETRTEFEEFNYVGDPSQMIRTALPESLIVNYPPAVPIGFSQVQVTVSNSLGPVEGARVAIVQNDTAVYSVGYTDASGMVILDIEPLTPDTLHLMVTAYNAYPFEGFIIPNVQGPYVSYLSMEIDDDTLDTSNGNGNGIANPGEILELKMYLKNWGSDSAYGVVAKLVSTDTLVTVLDSVEDIGTIYAGDSVETPDDFDVELSPQLTNGYNVTFELYITSAEGDTWISYPSLTVKTPVVEVDSFYLVSDDSLLDPGDTVELYILLENTGMDISYGGFLTLSTQDSFLTILQDTAYFDTILIDSSVVAGPMVVHAADSTPIHHEATLYFNITTGNYTFEDSIVVVIGRGGNYLIWDPDDNHTSGPIIYSILRDSLGIPGDYTTDLNQYISELPYYGALFITLGIYPDNYVIPSGSNEALAIVDYITNHGGRVYMEGGDVWYYDPTHGGHNFNQYFGLTALDDGSGDLGTVMGISGTFTEGMTFTYSGENNWIDHILAVGNAFNILENQSPSYYCGVANIDTTAGGEYRTVALSFELGGLVDGTWTKEDLLAAIGNFLGLPIVGIKESEGKELTYKLALYAPLPNPSKGPVTIQFSLPEKMDVTLKAYNVAGRLVETIYRGNLEAGLHRIEWQRKLPSGVYFISLEAGAKRLTKKVILLK